MIVVGISGAIGTGKTAFAERLATKWGFVRISFADALKREIAERLHVTVGLITVADEEAGRLPNLPEDLRWHAGRGLGWWDRRIEYALWQERSPIMRSLLQEWGTELRRGDDPDYWINRWRQAVASVSHMGQPIRIVAHDLRFVNEADAIKKMNGCLVRIRRPGHAEEGHASETGLNGWTDWDLVVQNDGNLEHLHAMADQFAETVCR